MSRYAPHKPSTNNPRATSSTLCQKCLQRGHFTYQCKNNRPYVARPSRTQLLEKPSALATLKAEGKPSVEVPEEFLRKTGTANEILAAKEQARLEESKTKKRKRSRSSSSESSATSGSDSESSESSDSTEGSSDSESSESDTSSGSRSPSRTRTRDSRRTKARRRSLSTEGSESRSRSR